MATFLFILQLLVVLSMIFVGARVGGIGLGIYGMVGVFVLTFVFRLEPGAIPIDVMLIIVSVIIASAALQAAGGLDYMVNVAARFLRRHPSHITYLAPLTTWLFCVLAGTAHTCYALLPIISEIAQKNKVRPERPLSVATVTASLGITCSPVSAATAAILSQSILGEHGIGIDNILIVTIPSSLIAILVASFVQNHVGKPLTKDPEYQRRLREGLINDEEESSTEELLVNPRAKWAVMMSIAALILIVGKADVKKAAQGNVFASGMNAMVAIFGVAWMGSTFFENNKDTILGGIEGVFSNYPLLFAIPLFVFSIMLFSQAATAKTLYPIGLALGVPPLVLLTLFPAVNGYFFLPNYPTEVAAIGFDRTGTTRIGRYVLNHSFQLSGFITTFVSIAVGYLIVVLFY